MRPGRRVMSASSECTVGLAADLHARPAGQVAQTAMRFAAAVRLGAAGREVDARSVLLVMGLGATAGQEVTVRADGDDAAAAVAAVAQVLRSVRPVEGSTLAS